MDIVTLRSGEAILAYHCDDWYIDCDYRTDEVDEAFTRRTRGGWIKKYPLCRKCGVNPQGKLCWHCLEHKSHFRQPVNPNHRATPVYHVTAFHAKKEENAITVKAFMTPRKLQYFLQEKPELYGCDANSGVLYKAVKKKKKGG